MAVALIETPNVTLARRIRILSTFMGLSAAAVLCGASNTMPDGRPTPTGLEVPRWISLKSSHVRARQGPGLDYPILWEYRAAGLPVQVIAENSEWRRICDPDGGMAWVHRRLTSGESTVMRVKPTRLALHKKPRAEAEITAYMNPRSIAELPKTCEDGWCRVRSDGVSGWAPASELWGTSDAIQCKVGRPGVARSR